MSNDIVASDDSKLISIIERVALDPNADVDKMTKIVDLQEKIYNKNAEIDFNSSMSKCQKDMPAIARDAGKRSNRKPLR